MLCDTPSLSLFSLAQETERHFTCDPTFAATVYSSKFLRVSDLQSASELNQPAELGKTTIQHFQSICHLRLGTVFTLHLSVIQPRDNVATLGPKGIRASSIGGIMGPRNATTLQLPPLSIAAVKLKRNE